MGQKVHPIGIRLGYSKPWNSVWYAHDRDMPRLIHQDYQIRQFITEKVPRGAVSRIEILRGAVNIIVRVHSSKVGVILGKQGALADKLVSELKSLFKESFTLEVKPVSPLTDASTIAQSVAMQLEKRVQFRRLVKKICAAAQKAQCKGMKISVSGRIGGVEIARTEWHKVGSVPLQTLRAKIDYANCTANTTFGVIGVKVWVNPGPEQLIRPAKR